VKHAGRIILVLVPRTRIHICRKKKRARSHRRVAGVRWLSQLAHVPSNPLRVSAIAFFEPAHQPTSDLVVTRPVAQARVLALQSGVLVP